MSRVTFNNTVLRDGHQSLAATRMTTEQMLPAAPILDEMGFSGLETWGGATIGSCLRFLNDTRNLTTAIRTVIDCKKHARGEICYTPVLSTPPRYS